MDYSDRLFAILLSATSLLATPAQAMTIQNFDRLAIPDQGDYVALMLEGAQRILASANRHDDLATLNKLFGEVRPGDQMSIGMLMFEANVDNVRLLDAQRHEKDHNAVRLEVEHAMLVTLKRARGIVLTPAFMHVGDSFRPKHPAKK